MTTMSGLRSLAALLQPIAHQAPGKHGTALRALFADWPAVIGQEVAWRAVPERLSLAGPCRENGVLTLRVDSADALELQHDAPRLPRLIEWINAYYGDRVTAIARITLVQAQGYQLIPLTLPEIRRLICHAGLTTV